MMESMSANRELIREHGKGYNGPACSTCGWTHPYPRLTADIDSEKELQQAFDEHDCSQHQRPKKKSREDVNQAAARIIREATEKT